jgi:hypothetical protein
MCFLKVLECQIVLRELAEIHDQFARNIEFYSSPVSLFMPLKDHIHQHFELSGSLFRTKP